MHQVITFLISYFRALLKLSQLFMEMFRELLERNARRMDTLINGQFMLNPTIMKICKLM